MQGSRMLSRHNTRASGDNALPGVELNNVVKAYGATVVIPELSLSIDEGEFAVIVGPSGCGKSTTLRMISGLESVSGGTIHIRDRDVTRAPPKARDIAMVFHVVRALSPHERRGQHVLLHCAWQAHRRRRLSSG